MTEENNKGTNEELEAVAEDVAEEVVEEVEEVDIEKELNDKYLRLMAEFDNFKKRTAKEKTQIYTSAVADVIEAIVPVIDNFERAVADKDNVSYDGIVLIKRQFDEILDKIGVKVIEAVGKPLNPEVHNAVMHVEDETVEGESVIVEEFSKGYIYKDKVIRHSTVKVAN